METKWIYELVELCVCCPSFLSQKISGSEKREEEEDDNVQKHRTLCPEPSCLSMKSDESITIPPNLSDETVTSDLKELDLSNNDLRDSGVKLLSGGLKNSHRQLNILSVSGCMVTEKGCCSLASILSSNPSHLRELDLSYNHPGQSLAKLLSDPNYRLDKLNVDHGGEIGIKPGLQKYACDITMDLNSANSHLTLSERNRKETHAREKQPYPDHPERFERLQVLCRESLSDRCYWEAEWSRYKADISVAYKGISRKRWSHDCWFGSNEFWSLSYDNNRFIVCHKNKSTVISAPSHCSNRVGVYLNWSAGTLSFYSVSDTHTLTHLHTFNGTFTEPLYAITDSRAIRCKNKNLTGAGL